MTALPLVLLLIGQRPEAPVHRSPVFVGPSGAVIRAMEASFGSLDDRTIKISSPEGTTTVQVLGKRIREDQPTLVWAFDGRNIYLRDRLKHVFVSGKVYRHRAVEVVSAVTKRRVDVFTRDLLYRRTPLEEALVDSTVRVMGFVAPDGIPCDILQADSPILKTTIFVRRSDHLPQSISTAVIIDGKTVSTTERSFTYTKLEKPNFVVIKQPRDQVKPFPYLKPEKL